MKSRPGKLLRASSLIASSLTLFLFFRSYYYGDYLTLTSSSTRRILFSDCCSLRYQSFAAADASAGLEYTHVRNPSDYYIDTATRPTLNRIFGRLQFSRRAELSLSLPYWPLALLAASNLVRFLWQSRKSYRRRLTLAVLLGLWPVLIPLLLDVSY